MRRRSLARLALVIAAAFLGAGALAGPAQAETIWGVNSNSELISFSSNGPGVLSSGPTAITGLQVGETVRGMDFRPLNGVLYVATSQNRIYTLNRATAAATLVGQFSPTLDGPMMGMDFNPVVDLIRIVTSGDENLRVNPNTGQTVGGTRDTDLAYDNALLGSPSIDSVAYTNPVAGATSTTLFGLDFNLDELVRIGSESGTPSSPNAGVVTPLGGINPNESSISQPSNLDISGASNVAFATYQIQQQSQTLTHLVSISLANGAPADLGTVNTGGNPGAFTLDAMSVEPTPAVVRFQTTNFSVAEDQGNATVTLLRTGNTAGTTSVNLNTGGVSATAGSDYVEQVNVPVNFAAGQTTANVSIPIIDDNQTESPETLNAVLSGVSAGSILGSPAGSTVTIYDVETTPPTPQAPPDLPPTAAFTSPAPNAELGNGPVTIGFTTSSDTTRVQIFISGRRVCDDATPPFASCVFQPTTRDVGFQQLVIVVTDAAGNTGAAFRAVVFDRFRLRFVTLDLDPTRDRTRPYRFVATGVVRINNPQGFRRECTGTIAVTFRSAGRQATRFTRLDSECRYRLNAVLNFRPGPVRAVAWHQGSELFEPKASVTRTIRVG